MLSEVRQRKQMPDYFTYRWNLKSQTQKQSLASITRGLRVGEMGHVGQRVQISSFKMKSSGGLI